jgi:hypothetical protein
VADSTKVVESEDEKEILGNKKSTEQNDNAVNMEQDVMVP